MTGTYWAGDGEWKFLSGWYLTHTFLTHYIYAIHIPADCFTLFDWSTVGGDNMRRNTEIRIQNAGRRLLASKHGRKQYTFQNIHKISSRNILWGENAFSVFVKPMERWMFTRKFHRVRLKLLPWVSVSGAECWLHLALWYKFNKTPCLCSITSSSAMPKFTERNKVILVVITA